MSWNRGHNGFSFTTGNGIRRKEAIGPVVNYGPSGQRYIMKANIIKNILFVEYADGVAYRWCNYNEATDEFTDFESASELDWQQGWQSGPYVEPSMEDIHTPEDVANANRDNAAPNLSFLNSNRNELTAAALVVAIVLIIVIAKA